MQFSSNRQIMAIGLTAGACTLGAGLAAGGCGSSSGGSTPAAAGGGNDSGSSGDAPAAVPDGSSSGESDGGVANVDGNTTSTAPGSCPNPTVPIVFSPMYSAFIPGDNQHVFSIPAVTEDGNTATWSVSDPNQANLQAQAFDGLPGALITVTGVGTGSDGDAGTVGQLTVVATEASGECGSATLSITASTENDWQIGNTRYNNNVVLMLNRPGGGDGGGLGMGGGGGDGGGFGMGGGGGDGGRVIPDGGFRMMGGGLFGDGGSYYELDGGTACTSCHGPTATGGPYRNVSHSPEQTGGFSDTDLINIFTMGVLPDGGYFDPSVITPMCDGGPSSTCYQTAYRTWHSFHQWTDITSDQYPGIIVYLRSLTPVSQNGMSNFGGRPGRRGDGGMGMFGRGAADAAAE